MNELSGVEKATTCIDARQLKCPMPLLKLKQALNSLSEGESVHLIATDRASLRDFKSFIGLSPHKMTVTEQDKDIHFHVTKGYCSMVLNNKMSNG